MEGISARACDSPLSFAGPVVELVVVELILLPNVMVFDTVETRLVVDPAVATVVVGEGGEVGREGGGGPRSGET